jgi:hypothetical protein
VAHIQPDARRGLGDAHPQGDPTPVFPSLPPFLSLHQSTHTSKCAIQLAWTDRDVDFVWQRDEKKIGIRSVITKTETRGPYTRPFTVYFVHTKTAFSVKGVCKRFSEFKELDQTVCTPRRSIL